MKLRSGMVDGGACEVVERLCRVRHVLSRCRDTCTSLEEGSSVEGPILRFEERLSIKGPCVPLSQEAVHQERGIVSR